MRLYLAVISALLLAVDGGGAKAGQQASLSADDLPAAAVKTLRSTAERTEETTGDRHEQ